MKPDTLILNEAMIALNSVLSPVEVEKFIILITREKFDYTQWREDLWKEETLESLSQKAQSFYNNEPSFK